MDGSKIIKQLMIERDISLNELAERLEIKPQSARNKLNRNSFTLSEFQKCLDVLGAELQVKTKDTSKIYT
ncbi:MAG: DUF6471 domain-containing protein [Coprococcus sp.]